MKIITNEIPEQYLCSMLLYVKAGSFLDGEDKGIAHVTEHMLVVFDKERRAEDRRIYEITAHTSYEYMVFVIKYDGRIISKKEVKDILHTIALGRTWDWKHLEECKEDVLKEIKRCRQGQESMLKQVGESRLICHLPLGEADSVQRLTRSRLECYMKEVFQKAEKQYISITPVRNQYKISILSEGERRSYTKAEVEQQILEYIFQDILYTICEQENQSRSASIMHMYSIRSQSYIVFNSEEYKTSFQRLLFDKRRFLKALFIIRSRYLGIRKFDMNNMNQFVASAVHNHKPVYQMKELRQRLYRISGGRLYPRYMAYVRSLPMIVRKDLVEAADS